MAAKPAERTYLPMLSVCHALCFSPHLIIPTPVNARSFELKHMDKDMEDKQKSLGLYRGFTKTIGLRLTDLTLFYGGAEARCFCLT